MSSSTSDQAKRFSAATEALVKASINAVSVGQSLDETERIQNSTIHRSR